MANKSMLPGLKKRKAPISEASLFEVTFSDT